jgi:hypothetical protein
MITNRSNHMPTFTRIATIIMIQGVVRHFLNQNTLGHDDVAEHHRPVGPLVGAQRPVQEGEQCSYWLAAVPGDEELGRVGVADDAARGQDDLVHVLQVPMVTRSFSPNQARAGTISVTTMAKPLKIAPATK